jgi:erythronate-4-phosphate dehydrogenase
MLIVADENIPLLDAFFQGFGEIRRYPGRSLDAASVKDADILLVRSVTKVDRQLLEGSRVRFVGTCTIGTDHLDLDYFAEAGIRWSSAPGCNARGVVDYVLGSLLTLAELDGVALPERVYGVVGAGEVGGPPGAGAAWPGLEGAGVRPAAPGRRGGDYVSLETIVEQCDVISLHTPLQRGGEHPTWHLLDQAQLAQLRPALADQRQPWPGGGQRRPARAAAGPRRPARGAGCVGGRAAGRPATGRPVHPGHAAHRRLQPGWPPAWHGADLPGVVPLPRVDEQVRLADLLPKPPLARIELDASTDLAWALATLCRAVYDPRRDDADFRRSLSDDPQQQRAAFDQLRKQYPPARDRGLAVRLRGSRRSWRSWSMPWVGMLA